MKFMLACLCGDTWSGDLTSTQAEPERTALGKIEAAWKQTHKGEGHGTTDASLARAVRRRKLAEQSANPEAQLALAEQHDAQDQALEAAQAAERQELDAEQLQQDGAQA